MEKVDTKANKEEFDRLLRQAGREGTDYLIEDLEALGFYYAPASTRFHLACPGGLVQHSLNTCRAGLMLREQMLMMKPELEPMLKTDSVIVATLLHDVCKADVYRPTVKHTRDANGNVHEEKTYAVNYKKFPMGHGEKSAIVVLRSGFDIHDDELLAIRWHMTAWNMPFQDAEAKNSFNTARNKYPLCSLVTLADGIAANLIEWTYNEELF